MRNFELGDWVQATSEIQDEDVQVAKAGDLGHVVGPVLDGWPNVYFERTGRVSICDPTEVKVLGGADTGREEKQAQRERLHVN
jgi:hypothetical protein